MGLWIVSGGACRCGHAVATSRRFTASCTERCAVFFPSRCHLLDQLEEVDRDLVRGVIADREAERADGTAPAHSRR